MPEDIDWGAWDRLQQSVGGKTKFWELFDAHVKRRRAREAEQREQPCTSQTSLQADPLTYIHSSISSVPLEEL